MSWSLSPQKRPRRDVPRNGEWPVICTTNLGTMKYERTMPDIFLTKASNANDCHWYYIAKFFVFSPAFASISSHALGVVPLLCSAPVGRKVPNSICLIIWKPATPFDAKGGWFTWSDLTKARKSFQKLLKPLSTDLSHALHCGSELCSPPPLF